MCPARTYFIFFFFFSSSVFFLCVCEWLFVLKASCFSLKPKATFFFFQLLNPLFLFSCFIPLRLLFYDYCFFRFFFQFLSTFFHSPTFFSLKFINLQKTSLKFTLTKVSQIEINLKQKFQLKKKQYNLIKSTNITVQSNTW